MTIGDVIERQVPALRARIDECDADFTALRQWRKAHDQHTETEQDGQ